jgi:hypothetical protein
MTYIQPLYYITFVSLLEKADIYNMCSSLEKALCNGFFSLLEEIFFNLGRSVLDMWSLVDEIFNNIRSYIRSCFERVLRKA